VLPGATDDTAPYLQGFMLHISKPKLTESEFLGEFRGLRGFFWRDLVCSGCVDHRIGFPFHVTKL
jgi:hypothetical protein